MIQQVLAIQSEVGSPMSNPMFVNKKKKTEKENSEFDFAACLDKLVAGIEKNNIQR